MPADRFTAAVEGWHVISQHTEFRQCARALCRWLLKKLNASSVGLKFVDEQKHYIWEECAERTAESPSRDNWIQNFPRGDSKWFFEGGKTKAHFFRPILDMLAEQWLQKNWLAPVRHHDEIGKVGVYHFGWIAVSQSSRMMMSGFRHICQSRQPLLLIGESGCGKTYLARLIHRNGPEPSSPFVNSIPKTGQGTLFIPDWRQRLYLDDDFILHDGKQVIAAVSPGNDIGEICKLWKIKTKGTGHVLNIPPLRERLEDIPLLTEQFLNTAAARLGLN